MFGRKMLVQQIAKLNQECNRFHAHWIESHKRLTESRHRETKARLQIVSLERQLTCAHGEILELQRAIEQRREKERQGMQNLRRDLEALQDEEPQPLGLMQRVDRLEKRAQSYHKNQADHDRQIFELQESREALEKMQLGQWAAGADQTLLEHHQRIIELERRAKSANLLLVEDELRIVKLQQSQEEPNQRTLRLLESSKQQYEKLQSAENHWLAQTEALKSHHGRRINPTAEEIVKMFPNLAAELGAEWRDSQVSNTSSESLENPKE